MKRLFVFFLVLALSAVIVAGAAHTLFAAQDDVEIREEYVGDRAAANGLIVRSQYYLNASGRGWNTSISIDDGRLESRSTFDFRMNYEYDYFDFLNCELWSVGYTARDVTDNADLRSWLSPYGLTKHTMDVASRTNPGEMRTEVVYLSDYYDLWPWGISGRNGFRYTVISDRDCEKLSDIFRFYIPSDAMAEVIIAKDSSGTIAFLSSQPVGVWHEPVVEPIPEGGNYVIHSEPEDRFTAVGASAMDERGVWLYLAVVDSATGENLLEYRDGPGIYFIPTYHSSGAYYEKGDFMIDSARLIYETGDRPIYLRLSSDEETLQLYSVKGGVLCLTVLDASTGEELYKSELMKTDDTRINFHIAKDDMFLIMDSAGSLVLLREENGIARPVFKTHLDLQVEYPNLSSLAEIFRSPDDHFDFAFDGERVAICDGYSMYVLTADETGLTYFARYNYSPIWDGLVGYSRFGYFGSAQTAYPNVRPPMSVSFQ